MESQESGYVCMNNSDTENVKIKRKKSSKRPTRKHSIKVKRKRSTVKRNVSVKRASKGVRSKSFIVKRKSFRAPSRWSSYLHDERKLKNLRVHEGRLPRVRGVWRERRYTEVRHRVFFQDFVVNILKSSSAQWPVRVETKM